MTAATRPAPYDVLKTAAADRIPAGLVTVVKGAPLGKKLSVVGGEVGGSLGDPDLDAIAVAGIARIVGGGKIRNQDGSA